MCALGGLSHIRGSFDAYDIRINWELNRHRQFALLAKSFYVTKDKQYLNELFDLFEDWNDKNPFLYGPEWASPMEESIRLINWLISAAFLNAASKSSGNVDAVALRDKLSSGAWAMAAHVRKHYSRYSSANNHTIVEAAGVGIAAAVFGETDWLDEASAILEIEIDEQTWSDGVNKEQALHYQLFVMEAICLFHWAAKAIGYSASSALIKRVKSMAKYAYTW